MRQHNQFSPRQSIEEAFAFFLTDYRHQLEKIRGLDDIVSKIDNNEIFGETFEQVILKDVFDYLALLSIEAAERDLPQKLASSMLTELVGRRVSKDDATEMLRKRIHQFRAGGGLAVSENVEDFRFKHWDLLDDLGKMHPELEAQINGLREPWGQLVSALEEVYASDAHVWAAGISKRFNNEAPGQPDKTVAQVNTKSVANDDKPDQPEVSPQKDFEIPSNLKTQHDIYKWHMHRKRDLMPPQMVKAVEKELERLKGLSKNDSDYTDICDYLDNIFELPWGIFSEIKHDIPAAEEHMHATHFGMDRAKEDILDLLSVEARVGLNAKLPIICLVGPPGIGKTSLVESISGATNRRFVRVSLNGVNDVAEVKGHRRTYVGAIPGRLIKGLQEAGTMNPVICLDEIDKIGASTREGNPQQALLDALDPKQNHDFRDAYLGVGIDLSKSLMICTANYLEQIPAELRSRVRIVNLEGYIRDEKLKIARDYLMPVSMKDCGLTDDEIVFTDDAILDIIDNYTREAGVRNLEDYLHKVGARVVTLKTKGEAQGRFKVDTSNVRSLINETPYTPETLRKDPKPGFFCGLAYTSVGGTLYEIEATLGGEQANKVNADTGNLYSVTKETNLVIRKLVSAMCYDGELPKHFAQKIKDISLHFPDTATGKDGPSAGTATTVAVLSAISGIAVDPKLSMTGEVSIHGEVLEIGGLKFKLEAAKRAGIERVLIPQANEKDLAFIPESITSGLEITPVSRIEDVLDIAFGDTLQKCEPTRADNTAIFGSSMSLQYSPGPAGQNLGAITFEIPPSPGFENS